MNIVFIQYGDYRNAVKRFENGGDETYYAQRYSITFVEELAKNNEVTVVCLKSIGQPYPLVKLTNGVNVLGLDLYGKHQLSDIMDNLKRLKPTHIILATPIWQVIIYANWYNINLLPLFADSFPIKGIRTRFKNFFLRTLLNSKKIKFVTNHNVNASLSLLRIGINGNKIIPWDWPAIKTPYDYSEKHSIDDPDNIKLIYVGMLSIEKGVKDSIDSIKTLIKRYPNIVLSIAGSDKDSFFYDYVENQGLARNVRFLGLISNDRVVSLMNQHDFIIVPSHHEYPEGLPMTIYESFCSRSPLISSDHPMFRGKVNDGVSGYVFKAGNVPDLVNTCISAIENKEQYMTISKNTLVAWEAVQCKQTWGQVITQFLYDSSYQLENYNIHSYEVK